MLTRSTYLVSPKMNGTDSVLHQPSGWLQKCRRQQVRVGNTLPMISEHSHSIKTKRILFIKYLGFFKFNEQLSLWYLGLSTVTHLFWNSQSFSRAIWN